MKLQLLGQFGEKFELSSVGQAIEETIVAERVRFQKLRVYSAFATRSCVNRLTSLLLTQSTITPTFHVGVDQGGTSEEALTALLESNYESSVIYTTSKIIYHPKIYIFEGVENHKVILGSSNLTNSGLFNNIEANVAIELDMSLENDVVFFDQLNQALSSLGDNEKILTTDLLKSLIDSGVVPNEANVTKSYAKLVPNSEEQSLRGLFPPIGRKQSKPPERKNKSKPSKIKSGVADPERGDTEFPQLAPTKFWFQTGRMTGGSGNILDLSLRGSKGQIDGGVSLFGLNPSELRHDYKNKALLKRLSIKYMNETYHGNDIVYPVSKITGETNGTPRLQIKGIADSGEKITTVVGKEGFKDKVMVFYKVDDSLYEIEILEYSENIDDIRDKSEMIDKPTARAKEFGILTI